MSRPFARESKHFCLTADRSCGSVPLMRRNTPGVAVAGTGFIGAVHARSARLAGGRLIGVAASTPERSERAALELGAERAFASAEELVTDPDVDVVHVCTPNHLHLRLAEAALAAGKHVICE